MTPEEPARHRREQRRLAIARACVQRLAEEGYADATLDALARDAGLTRPALLFYFGGKSDLWAEAVACAAEETLRALTRLVTGEAGPAGFRALRRGLDEVARVLPAAFAVLLDAAGSAPRGSATEQERLRAAEAALVDTLAAALAGPRGDLEGARQLAHFGLVALLGHHREARARSRAASPARPVLSAELDFAEGQLVALAQALRPRRG